VVSSAAVHRGLLTAVARRPGIWHCQVKVSLVTVSMHVMIQVRKFCLIETRGQSARVHSSDQEWRRAALVTLGSKRDKIETSGIHSLKTALETHQRHDGGLRHVLARLTFVQNDVEAQKTIRRIVAARSTGTSFI
jgi:hypothetical protein